MANHGSNCTCGRCTARRYIDNAERATHGETRAEWQQRQGMGKTPDHLRLVANAATVVELVTASIAVVTTTLAAMARKLSVANAVAGGTASTRTCAMPAKVKAMVDGDAMCRRTTKRWRGIKEGRVEVAPAESPKALCRLPLLYTVLSLSRNKTAPPRNIHGQIPLLVQWKKVRVRREMRGAVPGTAVLVRKARISDKC